MLAPLQIPYSKSGLDSLAAALNVNSAALCFNPVQTRLEIKTSLISNRPELTSENKEEK